MMYNKISVIWSHWWPSHEPEFDRLQLLPPLKAYIHQFQQKKKRSFIGYHWNFRDVPKLGPHQNMSLFHAFITRLWNSNMYRKSRFNESQGVLFWHIASHSLGLINLFLDVCSNISIEKVRGAPKLFNLSSFKYKLLTWY